MKSHSIAQHISSAGFFEEEETRALMAHKYKQDLQNKENRPPIVSNVQKFTVTLMLDLRKYKCKEIKCNVVQAKVYK